MSRFAVYVINRWNHFSDTSSVAVETRSELQLSRGNPGVEGMSIAARLDQIEHFLYNLPCGVWTALLACKAEFFDHHSSSSTLLEAKSVSSIPKTQQTKQSGLLTYSRLSLRPPSAFSSRTRASPNFLLKLDNVELLSLYEKDARDQQKVVGLFSRS